MNEAQAYDRLAADYHRIFPDWHEEVDRQGAVLDRLIRSELSNRALEILDASSGIGTQAIGLAKRGHHVTASDISADALERAVHEGRALGVELLSVVADMRHLERAIDRRFDVVLSCDNSIGHLLSVNDLRSAFTSMRDRLRPGGLLLVSLRDYKREARGRPPATTLRVSGEPGRRQAMFQLWRWESRDTYHPDMLFLEEAERDWHMTVYPLPRLRAWIRGPVVRQLTASGLSGVRWRMPAETGYHQPIATGFA